MFLQATGGFKSLPSLIPLLILVGIIGIISIVIYFLIKSIIQKMAENDRLDKENGRNRYIFKRRYWMPLPFLFILFICLLPSKPSNSVDSTLNEKYTGVKCEHCGHMTMDDDFCKWCHKMSTESANKAINNVQEKIRTNPSVREKFQCKICYGSGCYECGGLGFKLK